MVLPVLTSAASFLLCSWSCSCWAMLPAPPRPHAIVDELLPGNIGGGYCTNDNCGQRMLAMLRWMYERLDTGRSMSRLGRWACAFYHTPGKVGHGRFIAFEPFRYGGLMKIWLILARFRGMMSASGGGLKESRLHEWI